MQRSRARCGPLTPSNETDHLLRQALVSRAISLITATVICAIAALLAPNALAQPVSERVVRMADALIADGAMVSVPGYPLRITLLPPEGFDHSRFVWVPSPMAVRLVEPEALGVDGEAVAEIIGFTMASPSAEQRATSWLGDPVSWVAVYPEEIAATRVQSPVYWMLFIRLPEELDEAAMRTPVAGRERAISLQIGNERFPVRLAPRPQPLPIGRIPPIEASAQAWRAFGDMLAVEAQDPTRRWRVSLLEERFTSQRLFGTDTLDARAPLSSPVLRGVADTYEADWRSALSSIHEREPDTAARLLARLTAVVRMPDGSLLPVWPTDGEAEGSLLPILLSRGWGIEQRMDAARSYLQTQPRVRATVLDDAGRGWRANVDGSAGTGRGLTEGATLLISEVAGQALSITLGNEGRFDPELVRLAASQSLRHAADVRAGWSVTASGEPIGSTDSGLLVVRANQSESRTELRVAPLPVDRPGRTLGPAMETHDLHTFNTNGARFAPGNRQTAAFVYRDEVDGSWKVYLEARFPSGTDTSAIGSERIEVFFGPFGRPDSVIVVAPGDDSVVIGEDRWSAVVDLPDAALTRAQREGTLAIGFIRTDSRVSVLGAPGRSSWPRPMVPGQAEPGRFRLDLSAW